MESSESSRKTSAEIATQNKRSQYYERNKERLRAQSLKRWHEKGRAQRAAKRLALKEQVGFHVNVISPDAFREHEQLKIRRNGKRTRATVAHELPGDCPPSGHANSNPCRIIMFPKQAQRSKTASDNSVSDSDSNDIESEDEAQDVARPNGSEIQSPLFKMFRSMSNPARTLSDINPNWLMDGLATDLKDWESRLGTLNHQTPITRACGGVEDSDSNRQIIQHIMEGLDII